MASVRLIAVWLRRFVVVTSLIANCDALADIKGDETVVLFNTSGYRQGDSWTAPVHGWIFEREDDSWWRTKLVQSLVERLRPYMNSSNEALFEKRVRLFLVDNERGKIVPLRIGNREVVSTPSEKNGHFRISAVVNVNAHKGWVPIHVVENKVRFRGRIQLLEREGLSVISDIDDTIKVSNVLDKIQLLVNTFLKPFMPVEGMAELYRRWGKEGAAFHYVSLSPWQLYPELTNFLHAKGFPDGSFHLREFRAKDKSLLDIFDSSATAKLQIISDILRSYPQRKFVLVGDSGEKDPEVYGAVAREFQSSVLHIYARKVPGSRADHSRFMSAFHGVAKSKWTVFDDPKEIRAALP